jgi:predicted dehydrogenase
MLDDTKPGRVVIATRDYAHEPYIVRAMEKGYDVISEKPLATDEGQIQRIIDAEKSTGQRLVITLNLRFSPFAVAIKEIVDSGEIGKVRSLDLTYFVGTPHGSSYYHRWHAYKKFNGSMFVTKSCHHFDLINWWLGAEPNTVNAYADLNMFGANGPFRSEKCRGCPHKNDCEWYFDITENDRLMRMYVDHEHVDGYHRDGCVYRSNIDVWDTMSAQVKYNDDTLVTYTLNLFLPYEGFRVGINGEKGRLDARIYMRQPWEVEQVADFRITGIDGATRAYPFEPTAGGHWGADTNLKDMLFRGPVPDTLGQTAESREGALAALIGVAARRSAEWGRPVTIDELVNF